MASAFYSKKILQCKIGEEKYYQVVIKVKNGKVLDIRSEFGDEMDDEDFWYLEDDIVFYNHLL